MSTLQQLRVVSSDGCPIAVWTGGNAEGPPVVLLHGFALDHTIWGPLTIRPELRERCRLFLPDLRGHGDSGRPQGREAYADGQRWADDLATILDLTGARPVTVVAWSFGGRMLLDYVRHHGTIRLQGINLVAAASVTGPSNLGPDHSCLEDLCSQEPSLEPNAARNFIARVLGATADASQMREQLAILGRTTPSQRAALRSRPLDYDDLLATLRLPVLISHGIRDSFLLPTHAKRIQELIRHARISLYQRGGHAPFRDAPARFAKELAEFAAQPSCLRAAQS